MGDGRVKVIGGRPPPTVEEEEMLGTAWMLGGQKAVQQILDQWLLDGRGWNMVRLGNHVDEARRGYIIERGMYGRVLCGIRDVMNKAVLSADQKRVIERWPVPHIQAGTAYMRKRKK